MAVSDDSYRKEVGMSSAAWRIESNCGLHYIKVGGMIQGKSEDKNSYWGELGGQLGVICTIKIMESIVGSTALVVSSCDNISALRRAVEMDHLATKPS